ncbi:MAG: protein kinase domain-containing protein [Janthinobacterium lividum]
MAKRKRYDDVMLLAAGESVPGHHTQYIIERIVGQGAYGAVYLARDPQAINRQIALKEFFPARHPRGQAPLEALFNREKAVGMQASPHPLMPTFYEAFQSDGHYYIAQEFIVGATLDDIIARRHPLPRLWTLKWSVSLCDALAFLHSRQIVHHDLKPANIRITPQGHLTLLDFGAAQYFGQGHENDAPSELYGTEGYLPPELEAGGKWIADIRTDIFALGCILYEMVAGVAPDQEQINQRSMYVTNSLIQQPNADFNLVRLINKAISYNTDYRYANAGEFLQELRQIAPPVLLVSRKHLRFGEVASGRFAPPMTVSLYNAGGSQISGEIKARSPWICVSSKRFVGNEHEITVKVDPTQTIERGKVITGRLEISSDDQTDSQGELVAGDKWSVECSVNFAPTPGQIQVNGRASGPLPVVVLTARRGQEAAGEIALKNIGETPIEFQIVSMAEGTTGGVGKPIADVISRPSEAVLEPGKSLVVQISVPSADLPSGTYQSGLTIRSQSRQILVLPITLQILSSLDYLKTRLTGR